jgi:hypothetical protein
MNIAFSYSMTILCFDEIELTPPSSFAPVLRELCVLFVCIIDDRTFLAHQTAEGFLQKLTTASNRSSTSNQ